jgi:hypothetical protein
MYSFALCRKKMKPINIVWLMETMTGLDPGLHQHLMDEQLHCQQPVGDVR